MQTQRDTAAIQERVINAIVADKKDRTRAEIAKVAGVNASQVSHWCDSGPDGRQMRLSELAALVRRYGADVVLGPLTDLDECVIIRPDPTAKGCARTYRRVTYAALGHIETSTGDGTGWDREEALSALEAMEAAHAESGRMLDEVRRAAGVSSGR